MEQTALLKPLSPVSGPNLHAVGEQEGQVWRFRIDGKPEPKGSWKPFISKTTGRAMAKPTNEAVLKAWEKQVRLTAQALRPTWLHRSGPIDGPVFVAMIFVRVRNRTDYLSDGHTLRKGAARYPDTAPDVDKLVRGVLDPLQGIAYVNDGRVVGAPAFKRFAEIGEPEGVEIEFSVL